MIINYITQVGKIRNYHIITDVKGIELIKNGTDGFHEYGFEFNNDTGFLMVQMCKIISVRG